MVICSCANDELSSNMSDVEVEQIQNHNNKQLSKLSQSIEEQAVSEDAYNNFEKMLNIFNLSQEKTLQNAVYPDFYGGVYVDDKERLVIQIKDKSSSDAISFMKQFSDVVFKDCNYSYNELLNVIANY